jgi:hypothetical protein
MDMITHFLTRERLRYNAETEVRRRYRSRRVVLAHVLRVVGVGVAFVKTGSGITVNGEHDAEVQPEGTENYKFTLDSAAEVAAAAAQLAAGVAGAAEEKKDLEQEDASDADSELDALDSSDDIDEEGPVEGAELEDVVHEGMELVHERPAVDATLVGTVVAVKWTVVGWCVGRVTKVYAKPRGKTRLNVEVGYEDSASAHRFRDVGEGDEKDGGHYATVSGAACGSWVALRHRGGEE